MTDLTGLYFFFTFNGRRIEIPLLTILIIVLAVALVALVVLIFALIHSLLNRSKEEMGRRIEETPLPDPVILLDTNDEAEELVPQKSLDEVYAAEKGLIICPFCETFNNAKNTRCSACGLAIQE